MTHRVTRHHSVVRSGRMPLHTAIDQLQDLIRAIRDHSRATENAEQERVGIAQAEVTGRRERCAVVVVD